MTQGVPRRGRGRSLAQALCALGALTLPVLPAGAVEGATRGSDTAAPGRATETGCTPDGADYSYKMLSSPDFLNADVADVRELPGSQAGAPNSYNRSYSRGLRHVLDTFAGEGIRDVLVAGDQVMGHWGIDTEETLHFGPTDTYRQQRQALKRAADFYYGEWLDRFEVRGLQTFPAVGDHEIGDNPWGGRTGRPEYISFKHASVPLFKREFSRNLLAEAQNSGRFANRPPGPARHSAYAVRLHPEVALITLDVFKQTTDNVRVTVDPQQFRWARRQMATARAAGVDWLVVQGHTPIAGPVRVVSSSGLMYEDGLSSRLWRAMQRYRVNLYLTGEAHATTAHHPEPGDPVQITHGGAFAHGLASYLVAEFNPDEICLKMVDFENNSRNERDAAKERVWQTDGNHTLPSSVRYGAPYIAGSMRVTRDGQVPERSGSLGIYVPPRGFLPPSS